MISLSTIVKLSRQLYPTGRVFKMAAGSFFEQLNKGLAQSEVRAYNDLLSVFDSLIPDNDNFSDDDATVWERRLGLITNTSVSLADRKAAIIRKMQYPGNIPARLNYRFLEKQLQDAGFNVFVHENRFPDGMGGYTTQNPLDLTGGVGAVSPQYGQFQYGQFQYGSYYGNMVVNRIEENLDKNFSIGTNLRRTFFIGGSILGDFTTVPLNRKSEFRQLILKTKATDTVGFLFINYI